jgi:hypothetical protein
MITFAENLEIKTVKNQLIAKSELHRSISSGTEGILAMLNNAIDSNSEWKEVFKVINI